MTPTRWILGRLLVLGTAWILVLAARAEVRLASLFSDHMVLQRELRVPIWGWAGEGEKISVEFAGKTMRTRAENGRWEVRLPKMRAGGPFTLVVWGENRLERTNILVGDVWVCSGQSNMEWPMSRSFESGEAIANAKDPQLRLFTVPRLKADRPVEDVEANWEECSADAVSGFSAVAYYFGRALRRDVSVPIGLIETSWGGSPAEVWMSEEVLATNPSYAEEILAPYPARRLRYEQALAKWEKENEELRARGERPSSSRPRQPWKPCELYNGMIAPLIPYGIRGAIWYQGEANTGRAQQYRALFVDLIRGWRSDWGQGKFAFLAVQLAPWDKNRQRDPGEIAAEIGESDWAELREAQMLATRRLSRVGVAVITDFGDKDDIHPTKKEPVGERLALAARGIAYREKGLVYSGPVYRGMKVKKGEVLLEFDHVGGGLEARGGPLRGFTICDESGQFLWALAEIRGDRVAVRSPLVVEPVAVRYGWADYPVVNLYNREGLPASPFRTDDFPMVTSPKE